MKRLAIAVIALLLLALTGCGSLIKTDQQTQALWYEDGDFQAQKFKDCVKSATRERKGIGDSFYRYPIGDRTWSFTGRQGSDAGPITIKTSDSQEMNVIGFLQFTLTDDCQTLRTFHERIGLKYGAYFNEDGSNSQGWVNFLNDYIAVPLNSVMDRGGMQHDVRGLYNNTEITSALCDPAGKNATLKCGRQDAFKLYVQSHAQDEIDKVLGIPGFLKVKLVATETPQPDQSLLDSFKKVEQAKADAAAQQERNKYAQKKYGEVAECVKVLGRDACYRLELQKGPNPPQWIPDGSQIHVGG